MRSADALAASHTLSGAAVDPESWPTSAWWHAFGDPQLDRLMQEALAGSPTLREAAARTRAAIAAAGATEAALYPQVGASADASRHLFPGHGLVPPPVAGTWNTTYDLGANLSWQLDFWGGNRAAYEAALGKARAAEVDAAAARLALTTSIAEAYAKLEGTFLQLDVERQALADRKRIHDLTRRRVDAGLDSRVELEQTEAAIPATRERVEQLEETIALTRHQLAALAGEGPDRGLAIARPAASGLQAIALPSRIPAELLGRRPDLVAQRWRVAAAAHGIDAAKARFYPNVNLVALVGLQSLGASGFLSAASRTVAAGPALSLPIFDGGRLRSELAGSRAEYDAAVERYNQVLADALRDVADQLASFQSVQAQRTQERQALQSTAEAYALAAERYREGMGSYLQVLAAEAPLLAQRSLDARLHARELVVSIHLMRALGGGFDAGAASPGESRHER